MLHEAVYQIDTRLLCASDAFRNLSKLSLKFALRHISKASLVKLPLNSKKNDEIEEQYQKVLLADWRK